MNIEKNLEPLYKLLNLPSVINAAFRNAIADAREEARKNIDPSRSGLHNRTGNLKQSLKLGPYIQYSPGSFGQGSIYSDAVYSGIHEFGGIIKARNKPYLVFKLPDGTWRKTKQVVIPKRPYLSPAVEQVFNNFESYLDELLK